jgi:hypothetical protein
MPHFADWKTRTRNATDGSASPRSGNANVVNSSRDMMLRKRCAPLSPISRRDQQVYGLKLHLLSPSQIAPVMAVGFGTRHASKTLRGGANNPRKPSKLFDWLRGLFFCTTGQNCCRLGRPTFRFLRS